MRHENCIQKEKKEESHIQWYFGRGILVYIHIYRLSISICIVSLAINLETYSLEVMKIHLVFTHCWMKRISKSFFVFLLNSKWMRCTITKTKNNNFSSIRVATIVFFFRGKCHWYVFTVLPYTLWHMAYLFGWYVWHEYDCHIINQFLKIFCFVFVSGTRFWLFVCIWTCACKLIFWHAFFFLSFIAHPIHTPLDRERTKSWWMDCE